MTDDKASERGEMWASELDESDAADTENASDAQTAWDVESIRESWNPNSVRLPDGLQRRFTAYHGRLEAELLMDDLDLDYRKDRHYKPLVIALGLRELDAMDTEDIVDALAELESTGHLED